MTIQQRRLEILEWEKNNRNLNNRSEDNIRCVYSGPIGCAVGRLIEDKELCQELDSNLVSSVVLSAYVFNKLPSDIQELGQDFLADLQVLHDIRSHWDSQGLSYEGQLWYDEAVSRWC